MRRMRALLSVMLAATLLAGCKSASSGGSTASPSKTAAAAGATGTPAGSSGTIPVGAGPQKVYAVQQQPPAGSCHYRKTGTGEPLPDPKCTPGATSPAVTQANLKTTICRPGGYTKDIRPPVSVTSKEKELNAASYGYKGSLSDAEYDHLLSLQLGGDPNDARNLWVEPADPGHRSGTGVNNLKDPVETKLHTAVCADKVTLSAAQKAIASDWTTALSSLGLG